MKNHSKIYLIFALIFFALSVFSFWFIYQEIQNNKSETADIKSEYEKEEARRAEIRALENTVKNIEKEKLALESHFVKSGDPVDFLNSLQLNATALGATAEYSTLDSLKEGGGIEVLMKVEGSFESIYKYITLIENSKYELEIVSFDLSKVNNNWEANIKARLISFTQ